MSFSSTPLSKKLFLAAFVFDTLTTTKSLTTPTASKAGLYFELQYDTSSSTHPTLIGGKVLDHRLERSRVTSVPTGERNYHILYYLLAGSSASDRQHLGLDHPGHVSTEAGNRNSAYGGKRWRYLGHPTQLKVGINDSEGFNKFRRALRSLEFSNDDIAEICQMLAAILHIGQLEFITSTATTPAPDESGGYSHEGGEDVTVVKNKDALEIVAAFLGVSMQDLETSLGYKTKTIRRERVTVMLDPRGARANADELARTLYSLLVAHIIETVNQRICALEDTIANTISIVDFPGFIQVSATGSTLDQLLNNAAAESLYNFCLHSFFERQAAVLETEEVSVPATSYFDNSDAVRGLLKPGNGLLSILDDQMRRGKTDMQFLETIRKRFENKNHAILAGSATAVLPGSNFPTPNTAASFTVRHFAGEVEYPVEGLLESNSEVISGDLMNLINSTSRTFVRELFGSDALNTVVHPKERTAIVQASVSSKPMRRPSMARRRTDRSGKFSTRTLGGSDDDDRSEVGSRSVLRGLKSQTEAGEQQGAAAQFLSSVTDVTKSLKSSNTNPYFAFCLKPNDRRIANQFDSKCVRTQVQTFGIAEISQRLRNAEFSVFLPFSEFLGLAEGETVIVGSDREKAEMFLDEKRWPSNEARVGTTGVFLSERCWMELANITNISARGSRYFGAETDNDSHDGRLTPGDAVRGPFGDSRVHLISSQNSPSPMYHDDKAGGYFESRDLDLKSEAGVSAINGGDMFKNLETRSQMAEKGNETKMQTVDEAPVSGSRKRWLFLVWLMTFYIPDFMIRWVGKMPRKDVRTAWREKLAINLLIWLSCAFVVFFMSKSCSSSIQVPLAN